MRGFVSAEVEPRPPANAARIVIAQGATVGDVSTALTDAIAPVFSKGDNQRKLGAATAEERHLFVDVSDDAVGGALDRDTQPNPCPADPQATIDFLWISTR